MSKNKIVTVSEPNDVITRGGIPIPTKGYESFAEVLQDVGGFGRYQIMLFITILYSTIVWLSATVFDEFGKIQPQWKCLSHSLPENETDFCVIWENCTNLTIVASAFDSIVQEWQLVCADQCTRLRKIEVVTDVFAFFGAIIGGHIGDNFGRKKWLYGAQLVLCVTSVMTTACQNETVFTGMQAVSNFLEQMAFVLACTMVMEITDGKHRLVANLCSRYFVAYTFAAIVAYFTREWRLYLIICNFLTAPLLIFYLLVHESPRYLIYRGSLTSASDVLNDIASDRWNRKKNVHFTPQNLSTIPRQERKRFYSVFDLFASKVFWKVSVMQIMACLTLGIYGHAMELNMEYFNTVGPFKGAALLGSIQIFAPLFILFMDRYIPKFGRRTMFHLSLIVMIICYGTVLIRYTSDSLPVFHNWAALILTLLGYCTATSGYFISIVLITVEFFPTYVRSIALGTFFSAQKLSSMVLNLFCIQGMDGFKGIPYIVGVVAASITLIVGFFLQIETKGVHLPDTLDQTLLDRRAKAGRRSSIMSALPKRAENGYVNDAMEAADSIDDKF